MSSSVSASDKSALRIVYRIAVTICREPRAVEQCAVQETVRLAGSCCHVLPGTGRIRCLTSHVAM